MIGGNGFWYRFYLNSKTKKLNGYVDNQIWHVVRNIQLWFKFAFLMNFKPLVLKFNKFDEMNH